MYALVLHEQHYAIVAGGAVGRRDRGVCVCVCVRVCSGGAYPPHVEAGGVVGGAQEDIWGSVPQGHYLVGVRVAWDGLGPGQTWTHTHTHVHTHTHTDAHKHTRTREKALC